MHHGLSLSNPAALACSCVSGSGSPYGNYEATRFICTDGSTLQGTYFQIDRGYTSPLGLDRFAFRFIYSGDTETPVTGASITVHITIDGTETDEAIAALVETFLDGQTFTVTRTGNTLIAVDPTEGTRVAASAGTTGFTVTRENAGVGASFTLTDIADLTSWVRASTMAFSNGDSVDETNDASGNGNTFAQADTAKRPTFISSGQNGLPVLRFDGTDDGMLSAVNLTKPYTIVFGAIQRSTGEKRIVNSNSSNCLLSISRSDISAYVDGYVKSTPVAGVNVFGACILRNATAMPTSWLFNNTEQADSTFSNEWGVVGLGTSGVYSEPADADVSDVLLYNRYLTDDEARWVTHFINTERASF